MPTQSVISAVDLAACRRFSAALAAGDVAAALADAHPEIELHRPCDVLRGAAGVRTLAAGPRLTDLTASVHLEDVVADGDRAVARGRLELRRTDTGELTETLPVAALLEARDGQVVRWQAVPPVHPSSEEP
jgi:limonene-1,2-epoxide hydrolase